MKEPERPASGSGMAAAMHGLRPEWLSRRQEAPLEPTLPIIDCHHHLWDLPGSRYLLPELLEDLGAGHGVVATVYVQSGVASHSSGPEAMRHVGETEFAARIADSAAGGGPRACAAIVGGLALGLGDAAGPVIDRHMAAAGGRFRGVRDVTHWDAEPGIHRLETLPGILASPQAARTARLLAGLDLSLDVFCYHTQLDEVAMLADSCPHLRIVVNHAGTPLRIGRYANPAADAFGDWRRRLTPLARRENVTLKFGGLGMRFGGFRFDEKQTPPSSDDLVEAWRPYFDVCVELFGSERCMFESNFPVDKAAAPYVVLWNAFKKLSSGMSAGERALLFSGTAAKTYRL